MCNGQWAMCAKASIALLHYFVERGMQLASYKLQVEKVPVVFSVWGQVPDWMRRGP